LHFPTLQDHFKPFFTHLTTLPCNLKRRKDLQKYYIMGCWKDFFNFMLSVW
jgi:hypothetical protein